MEPSTTRAESLRQAASAALLAPSVHNTQPWRFVLAGDVLEIHADRSRQLQVVDPDGRQLAISCGCALFNARTALAARGYDALVQRHPDPDQPDLLARVVLPAEKSDWVPLANLEPHITRRHSNRQRFLDTSVPPSVLYDLAQATEQEGARLSQVRRPAQRLSLATLSQQADAIESADPAYQQELRAWTTEDPKRVDGVPAMAVPYLSGEARDELPIRDFDTHEMGWLSAESRSGAQECLLILTTAEDDRLSWLRAGEALQHLWLEATRADFALSVFTQVVELPDIRERLRAELDLDSYPHLLLRIGRASQTPASGRRRLEDVLSEQDSTRN
jgi:nitroreductase